MVRPILFPIRASWQFIKDHDEAIARLVSHIISPHIVGIIFFFLLAVNYGRDPMETLRWTSWLIPFIFIPPFFYVVWLSRKGFIKDIYMPDRETRLRPLAVLIVWLFICIVLTRYLNAPPIVDILLLSITTLVIVLTIVTLFWKISFHAATITAAGTATLLVSGITYALPVLLMVPIVGWSRIRLNRHTPLQVIYGCFVGALIAFIFAYGILFVAR